MTKTLYAHAKGFLFLQSIENVKFTEKKGEAAAIR